MGQIKCNQHGFMAGVIQNSHRQLWLPAKDASVSADVSASSASEAVCAIEIDINIYTDLQNAVATYENSGVHMFTETKLCSTGNTMRIKLLAIIMSCYIYAQIRKRGLCCVEK